MIHEGLYVNKKMCIVKWMDNGYSLWSLFMEVTLLRDHVMLICKDWEGRSTASSLAINLYH